MRKIFAGISVLFLVLASPVFATPVTYTNLLTFNSNGAVSSGDGTGIIEDYGRGSVSLLNGLGDYVRWTHSFTFPQDPDDSIITGRLSLKLRDDSNSWLDGPEFAIGWTDTGAWTIGEVNTGTYNYNLSIRNGSLTVTLASLGGDFYIDTAAFSVNYAGAPVPEPSSMLLVGLGMLSAGIIARRRNRNKRS